MKDPMQPTANALYGDHYVRAGNADKERDTFTQQQPDMNNVYRTVTAREDAVKMFPNTTELYAQAQYASLQRAKVWLKETEGRRLAAKQLLDSQAYGAPWPQGRF